MHKTIFKEPPLATHTEISRKLKIPFKKVKEIEQSALKKIRDALIAKHGVDVVMDLMGE